MNIHTRDRLSQFIPTVDSCIWLVTPRLELRSANLSGLKKITSPTSSIGLVDGRLMARNPKVLRAFEEVCQHASDKGHRVWFTWSDHPDMVEEEWIMSGKRLAATSDGEETLILSAQKMSKEAPLSTEEVCAMLGLTFEEARLTSSLASGSSLQEIADAKGVNITTIRAQLRSVYRKTDTSRQAELVSLVWRIACVA